MAVLAAAPQVAVALVAALLEVLLVQVVMEEVEESVRTAAMVAESTRTVRHLGVHSWRSRCSQCPVHNHHTVSQNHHHHKCHRQRTVAHLYMSLSRGNQRVRMVAACRSGDDQSLVDGPSRQLLEAAGLQQCLTGAAAWPAALQQTALAAKSPNFLPPIIRIYRTRTHAQ